MPTADELNAKHAIPEHLRFEETGTGLTAIVVTTPHAKGRIYTQGAHLVEFQPAGQDAVVFTSPVGAHEPRKSIHAGIPVIFPWFGDYTLGAKKPGVTYPGHGFARMSEWTVEEAHMAPDGQLVLDLSLEPNDDARAVGFDGFRCGLRFLIGEQLQMAFEVTNHGSAPMVFEDGLHTYYRVGDARTVTVTGLQGSHYLDKRDLFKEKVQTSELLAFTRDTDQVHLNTVGPHTIHDPELHRHLHLAKTGSNTTVVWNPWDAHNFKDIGATEWVNFVCVETANADVNKITLAPGDTHRLGQVIRVQHA